MTEYKLERCIVCNNKILLKYKRICCSEDCEAQWRKEYYRLYQPKRKNRKIKGKPQKEYYRDCAKRYRKKHPINTKRAYLRWKKENYDYLLQLQRAWRKKHPNYEAEWRARNRKILIEKQRLWTLRNREKVFAQSLTQRIKIPKGQLCVICKKELAKSKHHEDYSKPYEVMFVCNHCHFYLNKRKED